MYIYIKAKFLVLVRSD